MTSIPLTLRRIFGAGASTFAFIHLFPAIGLGPAAARDGDRSPGFILAFALTNLKLLLGGVLGGQILDQRTDKLLVGLIPIGHDLELGAIPLDDAGTVVAHVVAARCLDRTYRMSVV